MIFKGDHDMDNIVGLLLLIILGGAGLIAMFVTINLLLPAEVERTRAALEASLGRALVLGLVNSVFAALAAALFAWLAQRTGGGAAGGLLGLVALLIVVLAVVLALLGLAGVSSLLGARLVSGKTEFGAHLQGGALLLLACLTPYLGWFIFAPLVLWTGLGAAIQAVFRRGERQILAK
jgi:hypothetical protein